MYNDLEQRKRPIFPLVRTGTISFQEKPPIPLINHRRSLFLKSIK